MKWQFYFQITPSDYSVVSGPKMGLFPGKGNFRNLSKILKSRVKVVLLNWYFQKKIMFKIIWLIFYVENWLWKFIFDGLPLIKNKRYLWNNLWSNLKLVSNTKGQLISKGLFGILKFSQRTNERIHRSSKNEFVHSFFGRIRGYQKSFRNYLTFSYVRKFTFFL